MIALYSILGRLCFVLLALVAAGLPGCAARGRPGLPPAMVGVAVPPQLASYIMLMERDGERNWVLHLNELAVAAMRMGERDLAKRALDESILNIEAVFGSTPGAGRARTLFFNEDIKLFKGESHERCMAFLYRGILYMQDGDWQNARASFRSGALQDAFAEEQQDQADWAIFDYLIAVCETRLGNPLAAQEAFARAAANNAAFPAKYAAATGIALQPGSLWIPALPAVENNILVIAGVGGAPIKARRGKYGEGLGYNRGSGEAPPPYASLCGQQSVWMPMMDSVFFQATTRGGRPFDSVQKKKVIFKDATAGVGAVAVYTGAAVLAGSGNSDTAAAGGAIILAGLLFLLFSQLTATKADVRQWQSIPDSLSVYTATACYGPQNVAVILPDGSTAAGLVNLPRPGDGLSVVLVFPGQGAVLIAPPQ